MGNSRTIRWLNQNIVHVRYQWGEQKEYQSNLIEQKWQQVWETSEGGGMEECRLEDDILLFQKNGQVYLRETKTAYSEKPVYRFEEGTAQAAAKKTANGEVISRESGKAVLDHMAYCVKVVFEAKPDEFVTGLGQMDMAPLNLKDRTEYLYQTNMRIAVPFLISSANYGILLDTEGAVCYQNRENQICFELDTAEELSYYIIMGDSIDEVIGWLRELTGRAELLPRWAFGYIQSKEKYGSAEELLETTKRFRQEHIPLDCIVQDWESWCSGMWGEKTPDPDRYPDLHALTQQLHASHTRLMWSIWPNMSMECEDYKEFEANGLLLPNSNVYDAYEEEGQKLYWEQCQRILFDGGLDAWWCDNSEPFSDPEWNGEKQREPQERYEVILEESKKHMSPERVNSYGLFHAKGIYEGWRASGSEKRVVNLTRSTYLSGQKYGVIPWSGDISARWDVLRQQIREGLRMSLSGFPYWTLDIGGFFAVREKWQNRGCNCSQNPAMLWFWDGDYNEGVNDLGYQELYTRWLQFGTFLPIFRSHGTDTPREPWRFRGENDLFYQVICKYINLRYQLMPYLYSSAAAVYREHFTMMRSFLFDFPQDKTAVLQEESFMCGQFLLAAPVTEPMYYEKNSQKLEEKRRIRRVYLPAGTKWYDFWEETSVEGGVWIERETPIEIMPLYIRAGAILPLSEPMQYAQERAGAVSELRIYEGGDGEFTLYNDEGDRYTYQDGAYCAIKVRYLDAEKMVILEEAEGNWPYQKEWKLVFVAEDGTKEEQYIQYDGTQTVYSRKGGGDA